MRGIRFVGRLNISLRISRDQRADTGSDVGTGPEVKDSEWTQETPSSWFRIQGPFHWPTCRSFLPLPAAPLALPPRPGPAHPRARTSSQVNIDHETRELTRTNLQAATATCFDVAQGKTRTLMEKDSYPRFLKSPAYRDLATHAAATNASPSKGSPAEPSHT